MVFGTRQDQHFYFNLSGHYLTSGLIINTSVLFLAEIGTSFKEGSIILSKQVLNKGIYLPKALTSIKISCIN